MASNEIVEISELERFQAATIVDKMEEPLLKPSSKVVEVIERMEIR